MNTNNPTELAKAQQQLQSIQRQDKLLAQIETCLYNMKDLAHYAAAHVLTEQEIKQLNRQMEEQQNAIKKLKDLLLREK